MIEPEAAYVAGTSRLSPLTNGCSINPAFGRARQFTCSYGSRACATVRAHEKHAAVRQPLIISA
eukprot:2256369-Pleurochrysis_carterae.AAC.5